MLKEKEIKSLTPEIFTLFHEGTPLLSAGDREKHNAMTIGWAQLGTLWSRPVCTVYVRPQRHTFGFINEAKYFTVSCLAEDYRKALIYCGTKSGRDTDKLADCGLTVDYADGDAPYIAQAKLVLVCRKLYEQDMKQEHFVDAATDARCYPQHDYHRMYVGEVVRVLEEA